MRNIAVYGAGSYGQEIACLIEKINSRNTIPGTEWKFVGFFDDNEKLKGEDLGYGTILGGRDVLNDWDSSLAVVIAIANTSIIKNILSGICNERVYFPNIVDPDTSFLDRKSCRMGQGNVIGGGKGFRDDMAAAFDVFAQQRRCDADDIGAYGEHGSDQNGCQQDFFHGVCFLVGLILGYFPWRMSRICPTSSSHVSSSVARYSRPLSVSV